LNTNKYEKSSLIPVLYIGHNKTEVFLQTDVVGWYQKNKKRIKYRNLRFYFFTLTLSLSGIAQVNMDQIMGNI
jgi:hypothetical protein